MIDNPIQPIFYVTDFIKEGQRDSLTIRECFAFARPFCKKTIIFDAKDWIIDEAIEVMQHTHVIVDGVTIKQNDGVFDNIFRSGNFSIDPKNPNGFPLSITPIRDIRIIGKNGATLVGPDNNAFMFHPTQKTVQDMVGDFWGWRGLQVCFSGVADFEFGGFSFEKQRSWAVSLDRCEDGYIHDLSFESTVKNGDGVNLRLGCHDIKVENIRGITSDDMVAVNSVTIGTSYPHNQYVFPIDPGSYVIDQGEDIRKRDIYNIYISRIFSKTVLYSHAVALLSRHGHRLYNIHISHIIDDNPVSESKRLAIVGSYKGYGEGYIPGDIHTIRINHIVSNSAKYAIVLNDTFMDCHINRVLQHRKDGEIIHAVDMQGITLTNA